MSNKWIIQDSSRMVFKCEQNGVITWTSCKQDAMHFSSAKVAEKYINRHGLDKRRSAQVCLDLEMM